MRARPILVCCVLPLACGGPGPGGAAALAGGEPPPTCPGSTLPPAADCAPGYCTDGDACRPILDECGEDEVALLGGGCLPVGVPRGCWDGFRPDGDRGCEPILPEIDDGDQDDPGCPVGTMPVIGYADCQPVGPPADCWPGWRNDGDGGCEPVLPEIDDGDQDDPGCPVGTMPVIGQAECQPVGPPADCWPGWVNDGDGGCEPILPDDWRDCPDGTMPVIGERACVPLGDCDAPVAEDPGAIHVDAAYAGADADGSAARPYRTIQQGIDAAPAGGQVVVAPGEYAGSLMIDKPLRVQGRCASRTVVRADPGPAPALHIVGRDTEAEVSGLALSGAAGGVVAGGAATATLRGIAVRDTGGSGVLALGGAHLRMERSLVRGAAYGGVVVTGATAHLEEVAVLDTRPRLSDGANGHGIAVAAEPAAGQRAGATLRRCLVVGSRYAGVHVSAAEADLEETAVADTGPRQDGDGGWGVAAVAYGGIASRVRIGRGHLGGNRQAGVHASGSAVTLEETVVRDTLPAGRAGDAGFGVAAIVHAGRGARSEVTLRRSLLRANRDAGLYLVGSTAAVDQTAVRDTLPRALDLARGRGVAAEADPGTGEPSLLTLRRALLAGSHDAGVLVSGSTASVQEMTVRDTRPRGSDGGSGRGIEVAPDLAAGAPGELTLRRSLFTGNREVGVYVSGARAVLDEVVVRGTLPREADGEGGGGIEIEALPQGGWLADLLVRRSLVAGNRETGVVVTGAAAVLRETVVRDTLPREAADDEAYENARGIEAKPDEATGRGSALALWRVLVRGTRGIGVRVAGSAVAVDRSAIRDTASGSGRASGNGLIVQEDPVSGARSRALVRRTLLSRNREVALYVSGSDLEVEETTVRGTLERESDASGGWGVGAEVSVMTGGRARAALRRCLVAENRGVGVMVSGADADIEESAILRTLPQQAGQRHGRGVNLQFDPATGQRSEGRVRKTVIAANHDIGLFVGGAGAVVEDTVVRDTRPHSAGESGGGIGVYAEPATRTRADATVRRCLVAGNRDAGVFVAGASALIEGTAVRGTLPWEANGEFGDGLAACGGGGPCEGFSGTDLRVQRCVAADNARAGLFFYGASGEIAGTRAHRNRFAAVFEGGADPAVQDDNQLAGNGRDAITVGTGLAPAPAVEALDLAGRGGPASP